MPSEIEDTENSDVTSMSSLTDIIQEMILADLLSNSVGKQAVEAISNGIHLIPLSDLFDYSVPVYLHQQTRHHLARVGQDWPDTQQFQKGPYLARTGQWLPRAPDI